MNEVATQDTNKITLPAWETLPEVSTPKDNRVSDAFGKGLTIGNFSGVVIALALNIILFHNVFIQIGIHFGIATLAGLTAFVIATKRQLPTADTDRLQVRSTAVDDRVIVAAVDAWDKEYATRSFAYDDDLAAIEYAAELKEAVSDLKQHALQAADVAAERRSIAQSTVESINEHVGASSQR